MELGKLTDSKRAEALVPALKTLFDFVKNTDFEKLPLGRIEVDGDRVYVMNVDTAGASRDVQPLEMHREYLDVHIPLRGTEQIGWKPTVDIHHYTQDYDPQGDCALSDDTPRFYVNLLPGEYCIVFPEDAHAPAIALGRIRKIIGKVKL